MYATPDTVARLQEQRYAFAGDDAAMLAEMQAGPFSFLERIGGLDEVEEPIVKVMFLQSPVPIDELRARFAGDVTIVPSSTDLLGTSSGEMMIAGVTKATGLGTALAELGIPIADTVGLGDSFNDLEMLDAVEVGIVMGNAPQAVQDRADVITETPENDGVWQALAGQGLLG